jgi:hypothetical protein
MVLVLITNKKRCYLHIYYADGLTTVLNIIVPHSMKFIMYYIGKRSNRVTTNVWTIVQHNENDVKRKMADRQRTSR